MMKKTYFILLFLLSFPSVISFAQVVDYDGNSYETVIIGTQEWMAENLKTTTFSNGDPIPNIPDKTDFYYSVEPAWAYYNNDMSNNDMYGKLYNGLTAVDGRNPCPIDWHVPSDAEWTIMVDYMGGEPVAGTKLKNSTFWNGTDEVGFNAMPGGLRYALAGDLNQGVFGQGYWWSSEYSDATRIFFYFADTWSPDFIGTAEQYLLGMSIRCVNNTTLDLNENSTDFKESFVYPNPFSSTATLVLNNEFEGNVTIKIYNTTGQLVKEIFESATKSVTINSDGLSEGFYYYSVNANDNRIIKGKFIIIKD